MSFAVDARVLRAEIAPSLAQNHAVFDRNRRKSPPKKRETSPTSQPKAALLLQIITSTSKITSACVAHSQRACRTPKTCKNRRRILRFSSTFFSVLRAQRTAHSKFCFTSAPKHAWRLQAMIVHLLLSMHACCAPKSCRVSRKIARFPIETGANRRRKNTRTHAKHNQSRATASHHLQHI